MLTHRLEPLQFLPPPSDTPWSGPPTPADEALLLRRDGGSVAIGLPLFWYDPPWSQVSTDRAGILATIVGETDVMISALRSDLSNPGQPSPFHGDESFTASPEHASALPQETPAEPTLPARIVPYRPERYGLQAEDFDSARVIDVRIAMGRNAAGRFAYSPEQIARWEASPSGQPLAGGGWVPAATFPPDVVSFEHLRSKLDQLRTLSPMAAVFLSVSPYRLQEELPGILSAHPDGLILRLEEIALSGLQLAALTQRTRQRMNDHDASSVPLWVAPGDVTPDDAAKLVALGADAIAIDPWCDPLLTEAANPPATAASRLGYASAAGNIDDAYLRQLVQYQLLPHIERFRGLRQSIQEIPESERLGSFESEWAAALQVRELN